ncbi:MAG: Gfo/Idh/MocA family oxidoreductase [Anaerolineales bacterium]|nr:Gfo/Idh/MocA family oxidoreductase [Anaerolineales bacterium]
MSNLDKVRIGILGTGFGKTHAKIFSSFPDVEVIGIAGRDEQKTMEAARSLGIPGYTDTDALLNRADIDTVDICLPTKLHSQYAIAALNQGKDVFCETPIAYTMADIARMKRTAKDNGKKILAALFGRFVSVYKHVHDTLHAGKLGKPKVVFANRRTPPIWGNGWNENFILDLMLHDVDYLYWLMGKPVSVTGHALGNSKKGWGQVFIALDYEDAGGLIEGSGIMPLSFPFSTSLRVVCEAGAIDLNWHWGGQFPVSEVKMYPQKGNPEILAIPDYDPYQAECRYFVDCLKGRADSSLLSIESAAESISIALAAKLSLEQNGKRIFL